jgi:hypothetical protein
MIEIVNRSALTPADVNEISRDLGAQLQAAGILGTNSAQATSLKITLSENLHGYVWVAEIRRAAASPSVVMVSVPRPEAGNIINQRAPMTIRRTALWSQPERLLDLLVLEETSAPVRIAVLNAENVTVLKFTNGNWLAEQILPIAHAQPWPRDLRGRMILRPGRALQVFLPGVFCQGSGTAPWSLACHDSDDPWPLSTQLALGGFFAATRNFFTGALSPGIGKQTTIAPFYSAAPVVLPGQRSFSWMFAMTDGTVHFVDGTVEQTLNPAWGSDLASLNTPCGSGWQILVPDPGPNRASGDSIRAYEVGDHNPVAVSPPVSFGGAITALWSDEKATDAIAVSHKAQTGIYEAFRLAVACGQ